MTAKQIDYERADPEKLAKFDPSTKTCTMNCGPGSGDPRSAAERKFLCGDCGPANPAARQRDKETAEPETWPKITAPALVGTGPVFRPGVSSRTVVEAAYRNFEMRDDATRKTIINAIAESVSELDRLKNIEAAALNLIKARGRYHSEQAMNKLIEACK